MKLTKITTAAAMLIVASATAYAQQLQQSVSDVGIPRLGAGTPLAGFHCTRFMIGAHEWAINTSDPSNNSAGRVEILIHAAFNGRAVRVATQSAVIGVHPSNTDTIVCNGGTFGVLTPNVVEVQ